MPQVCRSAVTAKFSQPGVRGAVPNFLRELLGMFEPCLEIAGRRLHDGRRREIGAPHLRIISPVQNRPGQLTSKRAWLAATGFAAMRRNNHLKNRLVLELGDGFLRRLHARVVHMRHHHVERGNHGYVLAIRSNGGKRASELRPTRRIRSSRFIPYPPERAIPPAHRTGTQLATQPFRPYLRCRRVERCQI